MVVNQEQVKEPESADDRTYIKPCMCLTPFFAVLECIDNGYT